ncbi:MAG: iron ABC transporter permease [Myxococcales bacterium]|nr:iron ABC transporter permease [Myxococcales bacterium]
MLCALAGLMLGSTPVSFLEGLRGWLSGDTHSPDAVILGAFRVPRVWLSMVVGAGLAVTGTTFQGVLSNPLADPYILGVSGGASVGVSLATVLGIGGTLLGVSALPLAAFVGALGAVGVLYLIASLLPGGSRGQQGVYTLLLVGVILNSFCIAVVLFLRTVISPLESQRLLFWLMGNLSVGRLSTAELLTVTVCVGRGAGYPSFQGGNLNPLTLGDDRARTLGINTDRVRFRLFAVSSFVVGAAVAASGIVGFVGLVVPHMLRFWVGADHRVLIPASALGGAAFLTLADVGGRLLYPVAGTTFPVGAVTAFVGVPLFFVFLVRGLNARSSQ